MIPMHVGGHDPPQRKVGHALLGQLRFDRCVHGVGEQLLVPPCVFGKVLRMAEPKARVEQQIAFGVANEYRELNRAPGREPGAAGNDEALRRTRGLSRQEGGE